jgi:predicted fused transcriptional regulator/phosphomethylpyrimidine kinase
VGEAIRRAAAEGRSVHDVVIGEGWIGADTYALLTGAEAVCRLGSAAEVPHA